MNRRANFANSDARADVRERPLDVRLMNITASVLFSLEIGRASCRERV